MKKTKDLLPFAMTILGGFGVGSLTVLRMTHEPESFGAVVCLVAILMYGGWKVWESRITLDELHRAEPSHDESTVEICAVVEIALLVSLLLSKNRLHFGLAFVGLTIMAMGIHIRVIAIRTLGKDYSLRIRPLRTRPICVGPYTLVRHPAYLGTLICHTGIVLVFLNRYSLLILGVWYAVVIVRTLVEDGFLMRDSEYRRYAQKVYWRLIPGIL
jgi:protein-S-isoprenylcysteine O-methyltransferase Ste14